MMTPTDMLVSLDDGLLAEINRLRASIANESSDITEYWEGLGKAGGQREDHAAALLERLRPALGAMEHFCGNCLTQINGMVADPFGRKDDQQCQ